MNMQERLRAAMDFAGISNTRLAQDVGVSVQGVGKWLKRGTIDKRHLDTIAKLTGVRLEWLLTGQGPMRDGISEPSGEYVAKQIEQWSEEGDVDPALFAMLPEFSIEASAGDGFYNHIEAEKHKVPFRRATLERAGVDPSSALIIRVVGESMTPVLYNRDTVGINTAATTPIVDGAGYAIRDIDMVRIKLLYRRPGGGLLLRSYNRNEFPDEELSREEVERRITVLGRVFWSSRLW